MLNPNPKNNNLKKKNGVEAIPNYMFFVIGRGILNFYMDENSKKNRRKK
jgi:hypothetical protein